MSEMLMSQVEQIAQEIVKNEGCILYDLEFTGSGGGRTLRLYIDKESGISIDDCTNVSKALNLHLDSHDDIIPGGAYHLEVSSPGLERILRKKWHFTKAIGERVDFRLSKPLGTLGLESKRWLNCKHADGVLVETSEDVAVFELADTSVKIPYELFEKAKIVFDFSKPKNKR